MKTSAFGAILTLFAANSASAQDGAWTYGATIYGWLSGMSTSVDSDNGSFETDVSFEDILSNLDMVFMGTFEARNERLSLVADLIYLDLGSEQDTPRALFGPAEVDVNSTIVSGYALYRVTTDPAVAFDVGAGFRSIDMGVDLTVSPGFLPGLSQSVEGSWVDPLIAARVVVPLNDQWTLTGFADWSGSGGGDDTWQIFASAKYAFNEKWTSQIGYRYMEVSKELDGRDVNLEISGPVVAVAYNF